MPLQSHHEPGRRQDTPIALRTPVPADATRIAEVHVATWREAYGHLLPADYFGEAHLQGRVDMWTRMLGAPREEWSLRVAEYDGDLVGFAMSAPSPATKDQQPPRVRQLFTLYVLAEHHGTGAGQGLLDAVLGDDPAMLWVAKENPRAIAFYRRNGFAFDGAEQTDPAAPSITDARMVR